MAEMTELEALRVLLLLELYGLRYWVDGGWGVDALSGHPTRPHADLDLIVLESELPRIVELLSERGFSRSEQGGSTLVHEAGLLLDLHQVRLDAGGNGVYGGESAAGRYPASALRGLGRMGPLVVRCTTAEYQIEARRGKNAGPQDGHDLPLLESLRGAPLPERADPPAAGSGRMGDVAGE